MIRNIGLNQSNYDISYLSDIKNYTFKRMDDTQNGGNGDGKVNVSEAYNDLRIGRLFEGISQDSEAFEQLAKYTKNMSAVLEQYAGEDAVFSPAEWADFINGSEWKSVIDIYQKNSPMYPPNRAAQTAPTTMDEDAQRVKAFFADPKNRNIENQKLENGNLTVGKLKVEIFNAAKKANVSYNDTLLERIIDDYAGGDGLVSKKEYELLSNDATYKQVVIGNQLNLSI